MKKRVFATKFVWIAEIALFFSIIHQGINILKKDSVKLQKLYS